MAATHALVCAEKKIHIQVLKSISIREVVCGKKKKFHQMYYNAQQQQKQATRTWKAND